MSIPNHWTWSSRKLPWTLGLVFMLLVGCNSSSTPKTTDGQEGATAGNANPAASGASDANKSLIVSKEALDAGITLPRAGTPAGSSDASGSPSPSSSDDREANRPVVANNAAGAAPSVGLSANNSAANVPGPTTSAGSSSPVGLSGAGSQSPEKSDPEAVKLVETCIKEYAGATSYSDKAVWRMYVPLADNPVDRSLEMRIAWESPNKLAIRTANVSSAWTSETFETIAGSGDIRPFDNQRVVRPRPEKITWDWLMYNHLGPLLDVDRSNRPLALELLLNQSPLADWLSTGKFQLDGTDVFDQVSCKKVAVYSGNEKYVLWIDPQRNLILRCELPWNVLQSFFGPALGSVDPSQVRFSIDMVDAQINQLVDWSTWTMPREVGQVLVRRFVEPPPRDVPEEIGKRIQHVALKDAKGDEVLDTAHPPKPVMVLQWIDASEMSRVFIDSVRALRKEIQTQGLGSFVDTMLVTASTAEEIVPALAKWNCDLPVAFEVNKELGSQCGVTRILSSVVLANNGRVEIIDPTSNNDYLLHVVKQLRSGIYVADRLKKAVVDNEAQYASRLHRNIIDRSQVENLHEMHREIAAFPLSFYDIELNWRTDLKNSIVSGTGDFYPVIDKAVKGPQIDPAQVFSPNAPSMQVACLLDDSGNVIVLDQFGEQRIIATVPWEDATGAVRIHVLSDPWTRQWLAVVPEGLPRFWYCKIPENVFSTPQGEPEEISRYALKDGESPLFANWVSLEGEPILSVVTDQRRYLEFNPIRSDLNTRSSTVAEPAIELTNVVPRITNNAGVVGWNSLWSDRAVAPWDWLDAKDNKENRPPAVMPFIPEVGNWIWGRGKDTQGNLQAFLVGLEKSDTGETHAVLMNANYEPLLQQTLSVLPRQCKLLSAVETADQQFYWLATAPNFVLHLRSAGVASPDQMSFGERIYGATILPDGNDLRLVVVLADHVSCWKIKPRGGNP